MTHHLEVSNEDFELLGEPRMTMAQFTLEEQLYGLEESDESLEREYDQEIIQEWRDLEIAGDPPPEVVDAIRREQVRLAEEA